MHVHNKYIHTNTFFDYICNCRNIFNYLHLKQLSTRKRGFVVSTRYTCLGTVSMTNESCSTACSGTRGSKRSSRDLHKYDTPQETRPVCAVNSVVLRVFANILSLCLSNVSLFLFCVFVPILSCPVHTQIWSIKEETQ